MLNSESKTSGSIIFDPSVNLGNRENIQCFRPLDSSTNIPLNFRNCHNVTILKMVIFDIVDHTNLVPALVYTKMTS